MSDKNIYDIRNWTTAAELLEQLLKIADTHSKISKTEIERKWLLHDPRFDHKDNPNEYSHTSAISDILDFGYKMKSMSNSKTWYLSVEPELRFRTRTKFVADGEFINSPETEFYLAYKSTGDMSRKEIEVQVNYETAVKIYHYIDDHSTIQRDGTALSKNSYIFWPDDDKDHEYIISSATAWNTLFYTEVEFDSEQEANDFVPSPLLAKHIEYEVTTLPEYKMKNFWKAGCGKFWKEEKIETQTTVSESDDMLLSVFIKKLQRMLDEDPEDQIVRLMIDKGEVSVKRVSEIKKKRK